MSKSLRSTLGQHVAARLFGRVSRRPVVGPSADFFARFGLDDPWFADGPYAPEAGSDPFVYVSGAHYYANLRRMRARSRLLERLYESEQSSALAVRSLYRSRALASSGIGAQSGAAGGSLHPASRAMRSAFGGLDALVWLEQPASGVADADEAQRAGDWIERKGRASGLIRSPVVARAPAARVAQHRVARASFTFSEAGESRALDAALGTVSPKVRALVQRELAESSVTRIVDQVELVRRVVRRLSGVHRYLVRDAVESVVDERSQRPVSVATARSEHVQARHGTEKGLRPVLRASPALLAVSYLPETPAVAVAPQPAAVPRLAPGIRAAGAHRDVPVASVSSDVRTQRAPERAGPRNAHTAHLPSQRAGRIEKPTAWVASLARTTGEGTQNDEGRFGLDLLRRSRSLAFGRVQGRAARRPGVASQERVALAVSPVAGSLAAESVVRRSRALMAVGGMSPVRTEGALAPSEVSSFVPRATAQSSKASGKVSGTRAPSSPQVSFGAVPEPKHVTASPRPAPATLRAANRAVRPLARLITASPAAYVHLPEGEAKVNEASVPEVARRLRAASFEATPAMSEAPALRALSRFDVEAPRQLASSPTRYVRSAPSSTGVGSVGSDVLAVGRGEPSSADLAERSLRSANGATRRSRRPVADGTLLVPSATGAVSPPGIDEGTRSVAQTPRATPGKAPVSSSGARVASSLRAVQRASAGERPAAIHYSVGGSAGSGAEAVRSAPRDAAPLSVRAAQGRVISEWAVRATPVRRGVLAPVPTAYVSAGPDEVGAPEVFGAEASRRSRGVRRALDRQDAPVETDARGVVRAHVRPVRAVAGLSASPPARSAAALEPSVFSLARALSTPAEAESPLYASERVALASPVGRRSSAPVRPAVNAGTNPAVGRAVPTAVVGRAAPTASLARRVDSVVESLAEAPESVVARRASRSPSGAQHRNGASAWGSISHARLRAEAAAPAPSDRFYRRVEGVGSGGSLVERAGAVLRARGARRARPAAAGYAGVVDLRFSGVLPAAVDASVSGGSGSQLVRLGRAGIEAQVEARAGRPELGLAVERIVALARASLRDERSAAVTEAPRRALGERISPSPSSSLEQPGVAAAMRSGKVRRAQSGVSTALALPLADVAEVPSSAAWAESRSLVAPRRRSGSESASASVTSERTSVSGVPGARLVRRALAGLPGASNDPIERAVARSEPRSAERSSFGARALTDWSAGRMVPASRMSVPAADASPYAAGVPGIERSRRVRVADSGVLVARGAGLDQRSEVADPALSSAGPASSSIRRASRRTETPRTQRPFLSTATTLARVEEAGPTEARGRRGAARRGAYVVQEGADVALQSTSGPYGRRGTSPSRAVRTSAADFEYASAAPVIDGEVEASWSGGSELPSYASRAVAASGWVRFSDPTVRAHAASLRGPGVLRALARTERPEDVVQIILERSALVQSILGELPSAASQIVDRILRHADESEVGAEARVSAAVAGGEGASLLQAPGRVHQSAQRVRRSLPRASAPVGQDGASATQATRLAQKLLNLIHLAETERRDDARKQVRLAEDSLSARDEGSAGPAQASSGATGNVNIKALQRDVLEAVLREIELNKQRRQEEPDVQSIWW